MPADGSGSTSFVVIRTDWSVLTALRALDATDATHVIIAHHGDRGDEYHLFTADDIFAELQTHPTEANLTSVLPLAEWPPTPTIAPGDAIGDRTMAVVLDRGRAVGFIDRNAPSVPGPTAETVQPGDAGGPGGWTGEEVVEPVRRVAVGTARSRPHRPAMANLSLRMADPTPRTAGPSDRSRRNFLRRSWSTRWSGCWSRS